MAHKLCPLSFLFPITHCSTARPKKKENLNENKRKEKEEKGTEIRLVSSRSVSDRASAATQEPKAETCRQRKRASSTFLPQRKERLGGGSPQFIWSRLGGRAHFSLLWGWRIIGTTQNAASQRTPDTAAQQRCHFADKCNQRPPSEHCHHHGESKA